MHRLVALVLVAGCVPLSYTYTPATNKPVVAKPNGCTFEVVGSSEKGYEEVGILALYNGSPPKSVDKFKSAVAEQVCQNGGDAVIAAPDEKGVYSKGSIIKYVSYAEPVKPVTDMPATQHNDAEVPKK
jgi:hypothetical protein